MKIVRGLKIVQSNSAVCYLHKDFAKRNFKARIRTNRVKSGLESRRISIREHASGTVQPHCNRQRETTCALSGVNDHSGSNQRGTHMPAREITSQEQLRSLVGQEVAVSDWFEVSQERINQFAETTGDHQWIHIDVERAKTESPFGTTIAHGFLTLSLLSHLMSQIITIKYPVKMGVNYGLNKVRFISPVPAGSKIRVRALLKSLEEITSGQQLVWNLTVEREGGDKPCCIAEWLVRYYH